MCVKNKDKDKYAKLTGLSPTTTNANVSQLQLVHHTKHTFNFK